MNENVRCEDCRRENCEIRGINKPMPCKDFLPKKSARAKMLQNRKVSIEELEQDIQNRIDSLNQTADLSPSNKMKQAIIEQLTWVLSELNELKAHAKSTMQIVLDSNFGELMGLVQWIPVKWVSRESDEKRKKAK